MVMKMKTCLFTFRMVNNIACTVLITVKHLHIYELESVPTQLLSIPHVVAALFLPLMLVSWTFPGPMGELAYINHAAYDA